MKTSLALKNLSEGTKQASLITNQLFSFTLITFLITNDLFNSL